jgi:hypothetical protein
MPDVSELINNIGSCFAAGTLVHTKDGQVPIEKIKVGDLALSKLEATGEQAYKRVAKMAHFEDKAVVRVRCSRLSGGSWETYSFVVTASQPFYVIGHDTTDVGGTPEKDLKNPTGWLRADLLSYGAILQLASGESIRIVMVNPIWRTRTKGVGWMDADRWAEIGSHIDLREGKIEETFAGLGVVADFMHTGGFCDRYDDEEIADEWAYKCAAYNLEVEEFHTYYVGELGVWVHDTNCLEML